ncbi:unnamed protein product [Phytophthora fragariaefolia]|uniref:Unnamed protein product n=1 Tax=Phytophthora fragariaefolia TaxID=1490495 RepID=A0A9W6WXC1_9STRA|nr:unnamed protein product [Phytophthora fragariaefolia]
MSPNASNPNEILNDTNYFLWEFNARMALARRGLQGHVTAMKPEDAAHRKTEEWKTVDMKALAIVAKMLSPTYQSMIRESTTAFEAWETLREFFVKQYDAMARIIEAHGKMTLLVAKEMQRREFQVVKKHEEKEQAFKASTPGRVSRGRRGRGIGGSSRNVTSGSGGSRGHRSRKNEFRGKCFNCNTSGHKREACPGLKSQKSADELDFSATSNSPVREVMWLLDSGASCHMTDDLTDFVEYEEPKSPIVITVAKDQQLPEKEKGSVRFSLQSGRVVKLTEVRYVPYHDRKLVLVPALTVHGVLVQFERERATLMVNSEVIGVVVRRGKLFAWRVACGGLSPLDHEGDCDSAVCGGCAQGKMTPTPFARKSGSEVKTHGPLEVVHTDVMGPMKPTSMGGARYVVTFIDDFSGFALAETQTGCKLKCVRSDNGGEYTSKRFNRFCALNGIVHQTSAPYSPQQNGLAERMNRTLVEMARAMMHYMEVDRQWWDEAVMTAAHIVNRVPKTARRDKSPLEVLTGVQPVLVVYFLGRAPARYRDVILVHDRDGQHQRQAAVDDDDEFGPSDAPTSPDAPATGMEVDETGEQPSSMEVDDAPASEPSSVVSLAGGSQPNLREMSDRIPSSESLTRTLRMGGSEDARDEGQIPTIRDSFIQLPALSSSKLIAVPEPTRSLPSRENRIVFSGGSRPGRGSRDQQTRMLTSCDEFSSENGAIPLLTNAPHKLMKVAASQTPSAPDRMNMKSRWPQLMYLPATKRL